MVRRDRPKCNMMFTVFKARAPGEWYFNSGFSKRERETTIEIPFTRGSGFFKMKELKQKIKVWNREVFGRLEVNKNSALQQIEYWDGVESERSLSEGEIELKKEAKESFKKWVLMEEIHWRQLSRELWLKEEDRNTDFFHWMANAHRMNNSLDRIKINGV